METDVVVNGVSEVAEQSAAAGYVFGALTGTMLTVMVICAIVWFVIVAAARWKIFVKAGKKGWLSLIPFVSGWNEIDLSWNRTMAWVGIGLICATAILNGLQDPNAPSNFITILGGIIGVCTLAFNIVADWKLAKAFGKGIGFFFGLLLLNPIFMVILGFGNARYQGPQG